jgi:tyrosine-protein phosphatase YwqE
VAKGNLFLAMAVPLNFFALEDAQNASKMRIIPMIASTAAVEHAISVLYGNEGAAEAIAQMREEAGITDVWCTAHIMEDTPNTTDGLRQRFEELQRAYTGGIRLHLAAEYMLDNLFDARLQAGDLLTMEGDTVLVETSTWNPPPGLYDAFRNLQKAGYHPLFAHPERYRYLSETGYENLHKMGIQFQMNLGSILGYYGDTAMAKAEFLLEKGWYSAIGSDCHRLKTIKEHYTRDTLTASVVSKLKKLTDLSSRTK